MSSAAWAAIFVQQVNATPPAVDRWTVISAVGSFASAVIAAVAAIFVALQLYWNRVEANGRESLDLVRSIVDVLPTVNVLFMREAQREALDCYEKDGPMTDAAKTYLHFLTVLDVAALAAAAKLADKRFLTDYLRSVVKPDHMVSIEFLTKLQDCTKDPTIYEHLRRFAMEAKRS